MSRSQKHCNILPSYVPQSPCSTLDSMTWVESLGTGESLLSNLNRSTQYYTAAHQAVLVWSASRCCSGSHARDGQDVVVGRYGGPRGQVWWAPWAALGHGNAPLHLVGDGRHQGGLISCRVGCWLIQKVQGFCN